jgi:hypothetical protein
VLRALLSKTRFAVKSLTLSRIEAGSTGEGRKKDTPASIPSAPAGPRTLLDASAASKLSGVAGMQVEVAADGE